MYLFIINICGARCGGARRPSPGGRHSRVASRGRVLRRGRRRGRVARDGMRGVSERVRAETGETVNASYASDDTK